MPSQTHNGDNGVWRAMIGLEVHAQVSSRSKLFSQSATTAGLEPNTNVHLIDAAMPGMLPVLNEACVRQAVLTGLALDADIHNVSLFDRKHYFYADLPQGYQISQYHKPIITGGHLVIGGRKLRIARIHLEQDAGKSLHDAAPGVSLIDLNRAGVALMEIVFEPDIRCAEEASEALRELRSILRYIGSCDGNMEAGNLRADVNVSVRREGEPPGIRCELKNLNSMRFVREAVNYEIRRQVALLEGGDVVVQQTRLFDPSSGKTEAMRDKEEAHDYRYFPDPDLPPLVVSDALIEELRGSLPELPGARRERFIGEYGLTEAQAEALTVEREVAVYFEDVARACGDGSLAARWVSGEVFALLKREGCSIGEVKVTPEKLAGLLKVVSGGELSTSLAKGVFAEMAESGEGVYEIMERKGLRQESDEGEIGAVVARVLGEHEEKVAQFLGGREKVFGFLVGQVMRAMGGRGNPEVVNRLLRKRLSERETSS